MSQEGHLGNAAAQRQLREIERDLRDFELSDLEEVLRSEQGRRFYYRLVFEVASLEGSVYDGGVKSGIEINMAYREGMRAVGRMLMVEAQQHFPELWRKVVDERLQRYEVEKQQKEKVTDLTTRKVQHDD